MITTSQLSVSKYFFMCLSSAGVLRKHRDSALTKNSEHSEFCIIFLSLSFSIGWEGINPLCSRCFKRIIVRRSSLINWFANSQAFAMNSTLPFRLGCLPKNSSNPEFLRASISSNKKCWIEVDPVLWVPTWRKSVLSNFLHPFYDPVRHILNTNGPCFSKEMRKLFILTKRTTGYY